jgi:rRNA maturation endonuclease Nob1
MTKCFGCGVSFTVNFEEADADIRFCPHCGQASVDDIELIEDLGSVDPDLLYDDDDEL